MTVWDNGAELTSNVVFAWCGEARVERHYTAPGKPTPNAFVERLGSARLRPQRTDAQISARRDSVHEA